MERIQPVVFTPFSSTRCFGLNSVLFQTGCVHRHTQFRNPPSPLIDKVLPELPASFSMTTKPPFPFNPGFSPPRPLPSAVGSPVVSFLCPLGSSLPLSSSLGILSTCREQTSQFCWLLLFSLSALCLLFAPLLWQLSAFFCLSSSNTFLSLPPQAPVPPPASA